MRGQRGRGRTMGRREEEEEEDKEGEKDKEEAGVGVGAVEGAGGSRQVNGDRLTGEAWKGAALCSTGSSISPSSLRKPAGPHSSRPQTQPRVASAPLPPTLAPGPPPNNGGPAKQNGPQKWGR